MAKKCNLLFLLFGCFVCVCYGNAGLYVNDIDPRDRLQMIYLAEVGVIEKTNRNDGERVAEYLRYTGLGEGYAWCAAFVSWCFRQAGYEAPRTAWSPALFPSKRIIWRKQDLYRSDVAAGSSSAGNAGTDRSGSAKSKPDRPQKGDVFALWYSNLKRIGHAGFVDEWGSSMVITVEGNTREGNKQEGVYRKRRPTNSIYAVARWL